MADTPNPPPVYGTPSLETLRRKYLGASNNDAAGLDDMFFDHVRARAEEDEDFRNMLKASMDEYLNRPIPETRIVNGKVHIVGANGEVIGIQG